MDMFAKLGWFFKQEKKAYLLGISMLVLISIVSGLIPLFLGRIIDAMTNQTIDYQQLIIWVVVLVFLALITYGMRYVWRMAIFGSSAKLERLLRGRLFHHFMTMDSYFFQKYRTGDLMARTTNDLNAIRMVASAGILTLVDSLSQGLVTLFMMLVVVDWRLSLVSIIPLPFLALFINYIGSKLHYHSHNAQAAFSTMNDKVQESVTGMKVIKTFGEEALDIEDFKNKTDHVVKMNQKVYFYDASFRPVSQLIMGLATMIGLFYGGFLVVDGQITIGLLVAFISYITRLTWPMIAVGRLFNILNRGAASYERIEEILKEKSHIQESDQAIQTPIQGPLHYHIEAFSYQPGQPADLKGIDFTLKPQETLGIVGKTGSGKTTLFKLLMREYDHYQGTIRYNGQDMQDFALDALLPQIGYVPQDNFLFSTTILENIRFARPDASMAEVEAVAKLAAIHDDILDFPEGYETLVGERGVSLSGGQKQRIAIARALLLDPTVLIMDDSLSAVDAKTEEAILQSVKGDDSQRMTLIATHRLSSVMHADEILVLDEGRIVERGNHDQLISQGGWYAEMYAQQELAMMEEGEANGQ